MIKNCGQGGEGTRKLEPGSSHWCQPLGHGQKLMDRKFLLNTRKNFTARVTMHWNTLSREVVERDRKEMANKLSNNLKYWKAGILYCECARHTENIFSNLGVSRVKFRHNHTYSLQCPSLLIQKHHFS